MNSKFKIQISLFIFLIMIFAACENSEIGEILDDQHVSELEFSESKNKDDLYSIESGVLTFFDYESYKYVSENIDQFFGPENQINKNQFVSLETIYNNIHTRLGEFKDDQEDDFFVFIKSNNKYVELVNRMDGDQEVSNRTDLPQDVFANGDFVFKIGDRIFDVREIENQNQMLSSLKMNCGNQIEGETIVNVG